MEKNHHFAIHAMRQTRRNVIAILDTYSIEQLNEIPAGFNNNLIWNFVHMLATQQLLCYALAGEQAPLDAATIAAYRKGTAPEGQVDQAAYEHYKVLAFELLDQFEEDLKSDKFSNFKTYPTSYGVELTSITDAITFNLAHEALHFGSVLAIRKLLK